MCDLPSPDDKRLSIIAGPLSDGFRLRLSMVACRWPICRRSLVDSRLSVIVGRMTIGTLSGSAAMIEHVDYYWPTAFAYCWSLVDGRLPLADLPTLACR